MYVFPYKNLTLPNVLKLRILTARKLQSLPNLKPRVEVMIRDVKLTTVQGRPKGRNASTPSSRQDTAARMRRQRGGSTSALPHGTRRGNRGAQATAARPSPVTGAAATCRAPPRGSPPSTPQLPPLPQAVRAPSYPAARQVAAIGIAYAGSPRPLEACALQRRHGRAARRRQGRVEVLQRLSYMPDSV